jgi:hypothetical protein
VGLLVAKEEGWSGRQVQATLMTHQQNEGQNHKTQLANKFFRNVVKVSHPVNDTNK